MTTIYWAHVGMLQRIEDLRDTIVGIVVIIVVAMVVNSSKVT